MPSRDRKTRAPHERDPSLEEWRPQQIGPFTILKVLGEGGMGTVYLAEQFEPIRRLVALKLVKLGQETKEVLARFDQERQALSVMNHPNIAKVYDAGAGTDGRPYFVMEYVDGVRISDYCDIHELTIVERLELFLDVLAGMQHAHQKGIIHRDVKPSNILVTVEDSKATPKVIDFGLAQATEQRLTEKTLFTQQGQWIGTPEYMSPEQAGKHSDLLDTRADIYSLGVLLYELLTGHLPFDSWLLREAGFAEIQRTIQEVEPPKPSTRVGTKSELDVDLAKRRKVEPIALQKRLRGDLDWIVMCALEKEPTRRYASAGDFAADLRRHLEHKPAHAGPPSWSYRTKKFLRRYRLQVGAALGVFAALIVGLILAYQQYRRAEKNAANAENQAFLAGDREKEAAAAAAAATKSAREAQAARARLAVEAKRRQEEFERAQSALERVELLANVSRLEELRKRAGDIWPAWPHNKDALRKWLIDLRKIENKRAMVRKALQDIDRRIAKFDRTWTRELRELSNRYSDIFEQNPDSLISMARTTIGQLRKSQEEAMLASINELLLDQFLRKSLEDFLRSIAEEWAPLKADMRRRLLWANKIDTMTVDAYAKEWRKARRAIDANPIYRGFSVRPQTGLIPLGTNPQTMLEEFLHYASHLGRDVPRRAKDGALELRPGHGIVFVLVPPAVNRKRRLEPPIFIAKHEMTQSQCERLFGRNPSVHTNEDGPSGEARQCPAENVSFADALEGLARHGLRLPREYEWEHVARGPRRRPGPLGIRAWRDAAKLAGEQLRADSWLTTIPVASFSANGYGLYDLFGNVAEWCATSVVGVAMQRGGSFHDARWPGASDPARSESPERRSDRIGLRPVRSVFR